MIWWAVDDIRQDSHPLLEAPAHIVFLCLSEMKAHHGVAVVVCHLQ